MAQLALRGGTSVRTHPYPTWPIHDERDLEAVAEVVRSGQWGGYPSPLPRAVEFAKHFAAYQGAAHGVLMANGTVTLEVALKALGIGWRDEVIVPALTFVSTVNAVIAAGALPVLVDITPNTLTLDPDQVEASITARTRAIMPVHLGQNMADMDRLMEIAERHSLAIIEDSAHAIGQRWRDRGAGCFGEFGSFSHEASKSLTAGEGGTLLTQDENLARLAHSLIDCGRPKDTAAIQATAGTNYRLGELQAALLLTALDRLPMQQAERAENATKFENMAASIPGVCLLPRDSRITRWNFWRYILLIDPSEFAGVSHNLVSDALEAEGIGCSPGFPPMNHYELFQPTLSRLPVAIEYADRLNPLQMSFPIAEEMGGKRSLYLKENVFRSGEQGVKDAVEALAKIQRYAEELRER
ncbi:DegT/DnrJ/EryC1/StrS family aminotransferase [Nostoc sp. CHAB 5784]|uniref:DegT/DnrJ/EryC1/StrS family aminotransferase n=1 Tax=Nostoc mirabile TaxID=2907820 RepID=UPI001E4D2518|nr:DegT/DnrJ/EryC1/StrS family aminotransferase [Nostoc mirabile]MCC5669491.1 DegT/DnrJ/EryC1/StrS family aminotransferase [Nostoc mirabile CHAB5784]